MLFWSRQTGALPRVCQMCLLKAFTRYSLDNINT